MANSLSDSLQEVGLNIAAATEHDFAPLLNAALGSVFTAFYVGRGTMLAADGQRSAHFESLIALEQPQADGTIPADAVACVIYARQTLDAAALAEGQQRIAQMRTLPKTPRPTQAQSNITLGMIVAARADRDIKGVAKELRALNEAGPDERRTDMVTLLTEGTVEYAMALLGAKSVGGFLPPAFPLTVIMPGSVLLTVTSTRTHAYNKLCFYIGGHLRFFAPSAQHSNLRTALEGVPPESEIIAKYQFNLAGKMVQATAPQSNAPTFLMENAKRKLLNKVFFQPWQDGGIIITEGKLPLEGLLPLSGLNVPAAVLTTAFKTDDGHQVSSVLPINGPGFVTVMGEIAKRSRGISIRQEPLKLTIAKLLDEGTTTPLVARLYMTLPTMRNHVFHKPADIEKFDKVFMFVINHLVDLRGTAQEMTTLWRDHVAKVAAGDGARYDNAIHIDAPVDRPLNKHIKSLVMDAARVSKKMQDFAELFGIEIGFLFQKKKRFETELTALETTDPELAAYLRESRKWLEPLRELRDGLEHETYVPPQIQYTRSDAGVISPTEPTVQNLLATQYAEVVLDHLNLYVEELAMWCIQKSVEAPMTITEIPLAQRNPDKVERFKVTIIGSGDPPWTIAYSNAKFDDT
jgi:hypothetical protein